VRTPKIPQYEYFTAAFRCEFEDLASSQNYIFEDKIQQAGTQKNIILFPFNLHTRLFSKLCKRAEMPKIYPNYANP